jgi:hypothetical protein
VAEARERLGVFSDDAQQAAIWTVDELGIFVGEERSFKGRWICDVVHL